MDSIRSLFADWKKSFEEDLEPIEDEFVSFADNRGVDIAFAAYAIVFIWFGGVKLFPHLRTPVYTPVGTFAEAVGLPEILAILGLTYNLKALLMVIGVYETLLGVLFATRKLRWATPFFFIHQGIAFLALVVAPTAFFSPPFLELGWIVIPWMQGSFSAYVLKNLIFIGGFLLLVSNAYETRDR